MRRNIEPLVFVVPPAGATGAGGDLLELPSHFALAYDAWAPIVHDGDDPGHIPLTRGGNTKFRDAWFDKLERIQISADYRSAFVRWRASFADIECTEIALQSRLLIGAGTSSASEVGLTVHHTWGVPMIPGSALKGICQHYVSTRYGDDLESSRLPYRGVGREGYRMIRRPGDVHKALFGAPDTDDGGLASGGKVQFHDAWYVWDSTEGNRPFLPDVMTVHQRSYYGQKTAVGEVTATARCWPNDYESPTPIPFMTVTPGARFLVTLSAADPSDTEANAWVALAKHFLTEAILNMGVGGKASAGYGTVI